MDQITSMRIFIAVAECGALNGAARQMEISPSAVSKHIASLENKLGAQLLTCTTRKVALTEVGASYLQSCRLIIAELDKANSEASAASGLSKILHVAHQSALRIVMAPHLRFFLEQYPHLSVELQSGENDADIIEAGLDICIRVSPHSDYDQLVYTELAANSRQLIATPNYLPLMGPRYGHLIEQAPVDHTNHQQQC